MRPGVIQDPLGDSRNLVAALLDRTADVATPDYQPLLLIMLADLSLSDP